MDKKERSRIVAVKLEEVLIEEWKKENDEVQAKAQAWLDTTTLQSERKQANAMIKAAKTAIKNLELKISEADEFLKEQGESFNVSMYVPYDHQEELNEISLSNRSEARNRGNEKPVIQHQEIITELTRRRNSPNARIRRIVDEGYHLLLEDDTDRMQKFLAL